MLSNAFLYGLFHTNYTRPIADNLRFDLFFNLHQYEFIYLLDLQRFLAQRKETRTII